MDFEKEEDVFREKVREVMLQRFKRVDEKVCEKNC